MNLKFYSAFSFNKRMLEHHFNHTGEYPVLKDSKGYFWDLKRNPMIWRTTDQDRFEKEIINPITQKYDWLVLGNDLKIYSPKIPEENLISSPPIRVINILSPLADSDYEKYKIVKPVKTQ